MALDERGREKPHYERRDAAALRNVSSWTMVGIVWLLFVVVLVSLGLAWEVLGAVGGGSVEVIVFLGWLSFTLVGALLLDGRYV